MTPYLTVKTPLRRMSREELPTKIWNSPGSTTSFMAASSKASSFGPRSKLTVVDGARLQEDLAESLELEDGPDDRGQRVVDVELRDLRPGARPGIRDRAGDPDRPVGRDRPGIDPQIRVFERRVAQSETEREERIARKVEVAVEPAGRPVIVDERKLPDGQRKGDGQTARGIGVAPQDVGDGPAALLAGVPGHEDGVRGLDPLGHGDRAPAVDDDDGRRARRRHPPDHLRLPPRQSNIGPVPGLAFLDPGRDDRQVRSAGQPDRLADRAFTAAAVLPAAAFGVADGRPRRRGPLPDPVEEGDLARRPVRCSRRAAPRRRPAR